MNTVKQVVEKICLLPENIPNCEVYVDSSIAQGREIFLKQLEERTGEDETGFVDNFMKDCENTIINLTQQVYPHKFPDDYLFFLRYYGGLLIYSKDCIFSPFGIGPMEEDWYASILNTDENFPEVRELNFLALGMSNLRTGIHKHKQLNFFMDLGDTVQKNSIISTGPWGENTVTPVQILKNPKTHVNMWKKIANSFTEWLELAADTHGVFGYDR